MSHRILQLEAERRSARLVRDQAHREFRTLKSRIPKETQKLATALLEDLRTQSRERRNRPFDSIEDYLQWLAAVSSESATRFEAIDSDTGRLALAELRLMVANDTVCVINRELTRLQGEKANWLARRGDSVFARETRFRTTTAAG
jgi:hypothetical protein